MATAHDSPPPDEPDEDDDGADPAGAGAGAGGAAGVVGDPGVGEDLWPDDAARSAGRLPMDVPYEEAGGSVVADAQVPIGAPVGPVVALGTGAAGTKVAAAAVAG